VRHLFVTNDFPPKTGGIESYLTALCRGFDPDDVAVVAPAREGHQQADAELAYRVFRIAGTYLRATRAVRTAVVTAALEHRADVVHFLQALPLGRLAAPVRKDTGLPVTIVAHGSGEILVPARVPVLRSVLRHVLRSADLVLPVSAFTEEAVRRVAKGRVRTAILHPCVDTTRFSLTVSGHPIREQLGLGGRFVVLFVSRLVKRKGADTLLRAVAGLQGATALIVGAGPEERALRRLAETLEMKGRAVFAGRVPDDLLPEYFAAGDVFCMPCSDRLGGVDTEGFGIVYVEAAASGLPVVAGRCGGSVDAVEDGVTGFVLDEPTPAELVQTLHRLQIHPDLRARLGAAGRERVEAGFSPQAAAERLDAEVGTLRAGS
jgi:phosphatidyl-myo-inositol dimannoside synthase